MDRRKFLEVLGGSALYADSSARINEAMALLVERARASGDIRPSADSADLLRALIGFAYVNSAPDWEASARRLIDLLIDRLDTVSDITLRRATYDEH